MSGDHQRASHSWVRWSTAPENSSSSGRFAPYHWGRSQPAASKYSAPSASVRECRALVRRGRFESHCSRGWLMPYTLGKPSAARARTCSRVRWEGWKRAMSEPWASISLLPSVISSATMRPTPAASLIHTAAADHSPATSGVSPTRAPPSGVRESSPLSAAFRGGSGSVSRLGKSPRAWASCAVKSSSVKGKLVGLAWPGWFPTGGISLGSCSRGRCA